MSQPLMKNKSNAFLFILALLGFFIALYLSRQYLTDSPVVCLTGGCEKVRLSPYSKIFGVPVPLFGLVGYTVILTLSFFRTWSDSLEKRLIKPIFYVSAGGLLFSSYNNLVDWFLIKAFCQYCFVCLLIMISLTTISKKELREN